MDTDTAIPETQQMQIVTIRTHAAETRRETMDGRAYLVVPCVALVEGVVNSELALSDEFARTVEAWNGIPLPIQHPTNKDGQFVSANSPDILESWVIGRAFNFSYRGDGKLRCEMWIDIEKAESRADGRDVLARMENGKPTEVSTAYFRDLEAKEGEYNGKPFYGIQRNMIPDHLAILPGVKGACSWEDGCGVPRTNSAEPCTNCKCQQQPVTASEDEEGDDTATAVILDASTHNVAFCPGQNPWANTNTFTPPPVYTAAPPTPAPALVANATGVMVALFLPEAAAQQIAALPIDWPEGSSILRPEEYHITLAYLGDTETAVGDHDELLSAVGNFAQHAPLVYGRAGGVGRFMKESDGRQPVWLQFDSTYIQRWRERLLEWVGIAEAETRGFTPHITLGYVPTAAPTPNIQPNGLELALDKISVAWGDRVTDFALQGADRNTAETAVANLFKEDDMANTTPAPDVPETDVNGQDGAAPTQAAPADRNPQPGSDTPVVNEAQIAIAVNTAVNAAVEGLGPQIQDMVQAAFAPYAEVLTEIQANAQSERQALVDALVANKRNPFPKERLEQFTTQELRDMNDAMRPVNYAGRGMDTVPYTVPATNGRVQANDDDELEPLAAPGVFNQEGNQ